MAEGPGNIALVGFMGTGKTSVGKILGKKLNREVIDVDQYIETTQKRKISEIFEKEGEVFFRAVEKKAIRDISGRRGIVITTGGGAVLDPQNIQVLKETGWVVCLSAPPETVFSRVKYSRHQPLLAGKDTLAEIRHLLRIREPFYAEADFRVETGGCTSAQAADEILKILKEKLA